jgi:hypothetical protein
MILKYFLKKNKGKILFKSFFTFCVVFRQIGKEMEEENLKPTNF